ncbi:hypothetical protein POM88_051032 [Heracleum sosnowskyi]|uniref:Uncharacterized protein n=1 Tax=Heracleum sosnowskyi TaxID=360622 RepID=A0AAD8H1D1_9APIA|nr:hypothetical protein POM88_051032 [Heracleum sosnowskyi]
MTESSFLFSGDLQEKKVPLLWSKEWALESFYVSSPSLFVSALIETKRRTWALTRPTLGIEPRKGHNELFYKQSPENMKSIAASSLFCASAASSYLSSFLQTMFQ